MTNKEIILEVKKLISDEKNFTTNVLARDDKGEGVFPQSQDACRFCLLGAIDRVCHLHKIAIEQKLEVEEQIKKAVYRWNYTSILDLNDNHGHSAVISVLDEVIYIYERNEKLLSQNS